MYLPRHPHTYIEYTSELPTPIGIDLFFLLPWLSGQQVVDTGKAELPTHWIFIRPQITETTGMCSFIFTAKPPAMRITQQSHSPTIPIALHYPFPLSLTSAFSPSPSFFFFFLYSISLSSHSVFFNALSVLVSLAFIPFTFTLHHFSLSCMSHWSG